MNTRVIFVLALVAALLAPPLIERLVAAELPPRPTLVSFACDPRACTVVWQLGAGTRSGAALLAPVSGDLLAAMDAPPTSPIRTRVESDSWRPGQPLEVLEWGDGWGRRTRWTPTATYLPTVRNHR